MNYYPGPDFHVTDLDDHLTSSSEVVAAHLAGGRLVKAFNTMRYTTLAPAGDPTESMDDRLALFVAADDFDAKTLVSDTIDSLGFAPIDAGSLAVGGRLQQPGSPVYDAGMTGGQARKALLAHE